LEYVTLGSTGICVSRLAFGAGPVGAVMVGDDMRIQRELVQRVLDAGINWIDTAAGYGNGRAERAVGAVLATLDAHQEVHVATKVRLQESQLDDIPRAIRESVSASLERLGLKHVTLLQLHNSITEHRGDEPDSVTPHDVLGHGGVREVFEQLRLDGVVKAVGITAIGHVRPLHEVISSDCFHTIQVPYNLVNPSAGQPMPDSFPETNYGNVIRHAAKQRMGVFVIRVYAGGALAGNPPSSHTLTTKYFPLDLFERDQLRATRLKNLASDGMGLTEMALRFPLSHPDVSSVIVGFSEPRHVDEAVTYLNAGPVPQHLIAKLREFDFR